MKDKSYWTARLRDDAPAVVIAELQQAIAAGDQATVAHGLLALVEAMGKSHGRKLKSHLARLCEHVILLKHLARDSVVLERNAVHWRGEVNTFRVKIRGLLEQEPHFQRELPAMLEEVLPGAKHAALDHVPELPFRSWRDIPDVTLDDLLPAAPRD